MGEIHIPPLQPEALFTIGSITITNTIINTWIAIVIFLIIGIAIKRKNTLKPGKLQNAGEYILELLVFKIFIYLSAVKIVVLQKYKKKRGTRS